MYLIISEDGNPSVSKELTKEIKESIEAGIVDIFDLSCEPVKALTPNGVWEEVEEYEAYKELDQEGVIS